MNVLLPLLAFMIDMFQIFWVCVHYLMTPKLFM